MQMTVVPLHHLLPPLLLRMQYGYRTHKEDWPEPYIFNTHTTHTNAHTCALAHTQTHMYAQIFTHTLAYTHNHTKHMHT